MSTCIFARLELRLQLRYIGNFTESYLLRQMSTGPSTSAELTSADVLKIAETVLTEFGSNASTSDLTGQSTTLPPYMVKSSTDTTIRSYPEKWSKIDPQAASPSMEQYLTNHPDIALSIVKSFPQAPREGQTFASQPILPEVNTSSATKSEQADPTPPPAGTEVKRGRGRPRGTGGGRGGRGRRGRGF